MLNEQGPESRPKMSGKRKKEQAPKKPGKNTPQMSSNNLHRCQERKLHKPKERKLHRSQKRKLHIRHERELHNRQERYSRGCVKQTEGKSRKGQGNPGRRTRQKSTPNPPLNSQSPSLLRQSQYPRQVLHPSLLHHFPRQSLQHPSCMPTPLRPMTPPQPPQRLTWTLRTKITLQHRHTLFCRMVPPLTPRTEDRHAQQRPAARPGATRLADHLHHAHDMRHGTRRRWISHMFKHTVGVDEWFEGHEYSSNERVRRIIACGMQIQVLIQSSTRPRIPWREVKMLQQILQSNLQSPPIGDPSLKGKRLRIENRHNSPVAHQIHPRSVLQMRKVIRNSMAQEDNRPKSPMGKVALKRRC